MMWLRGLLYTGRLQSIGVGRPLYLRLAKTSGCDVAPFLTHGYHNRRILSATNLRSSGVLERKRRLSVGARPRVVNDSIEIWREGSSNPVQIPNIYLRDNCQCSSCIHEATKQRLLDTFKIPPSIAINSSVFERDGIRVKWNDGHNSFYSNDWLRHSLKDEEDDIRHGSTEVKLWGSEISKSPPVADFEKIMSSDDGVKVWLGHIRKYGFSFVEGCPVTPEASKALLERITFIRETHYGGFYDFTADLSSKDTAYTSIALDAHTDTTYFSDPAGLQMFHLLSHTEGDGGTSLLVDGFKAAEILRRDESEAYEVLSSVNVYAHASGNEGVSIQPFRPFPVLLHDCSGENLIQVRWNTSDRAKIDMPVDKVGQWYEAARKFDTILRSPKLEYWEQLKLGRPLIFDNWRILHGRSAFTGNRRICGAYVNRDDFISRFRILNWGQNEVLRTIGTA